MTAAVAAIGWVNKGIAVGRQDDVDGVVNYT